MPLVDLIATTLILIMLVVLFPFSAIDKILHWDDAIKQARSGILPGAPLLIGSAIVIEFVTPICIVLGWHDRLAAFILAGFCAVTAVLFHPFWAQGDFWVQGDSKGRSEFWDFLKNFGLVGGLLLVTLGTRLAPAGSVLHDPLSSTELNAAHVDAGTASSSTAP